MLISFCITGHQWLKRNLDVVPKSGWSIDPFGHGSTQPYLLAQSGLKGTIIQRIHYAWKQWLAHKQYGDFRWIPGWVPSSATSSILTHNQPFDIYSIKHSCGPHPYICLNFDFRKVQGEYTEYSIKAQTITDKNVKEKSELLLEQYARTGSLFPHNVVLMPLGDDFRYNVVEEWDQQYTNYMKLIDYINSNKERYGVEVAFGTPLDYFKEIVKRYDQFPTLKGDFFVYSDIFSEGRPAYWSGYYTTRPFMKVLDREVESSLRGAEILYTLALNNARKNKLVSYLKILERDFEKLVQARRNLGLFQHHDAITGTSKSFVMHDYGLRLFDALRSTANVQQNAIQSLMFGNVSTFRPDQGIVLQDVERDSYQRLARKTPIVLSPGKSRHIILYNSLAQPQDYFVEVHTTTTKVKVLDERGQEIVYQLNPVWNSTETHNRMLVSEKEFVLIFIAKLPALSLTTYNITHTDEDNADKLSIVYCNKCNSKSGESTEMLQTIFKVKRNQPGDIQLENHKFKLLFNGNSGFLKTVTRKHKQKIMQCAVQFAAYRSAQFHSGAYLFMPDPNERDIEKDILLQYKDEMSIVITSGPVASEVTVIYGPFLVHSVRIFHAEDSAISNGIYIENEVDFESPPKNREMELFMRIVSDVQNGDPPQFYSDSNGFQMQKRVKVERIGVEGNYFPITSMAYIQDDSVRLSLLTNHAQGAAAWQPGFLEVMLDRRTLYDDSRGMGEGLVDNRRTLTKYWLLLEDVKVSNRREFGDSRANELFEKDDVIRSFNVPTQSRQPAGDEHFSLPSLQANQLSNSLNYPVGIFIVEEENSELLVRNSMRLLTKQLPCDLHLLTLRSQPDFVYPQFPSSSALVVLHRQGYDWAVNCNYACKVSNIETDTNFAPHRVKEWVPMTLTGNIVTSKTHEELADVKILPMDLQTFNVTFS